MLSGAPRHRASQRRGGFVRAGRLGPRRARSRGRCGRRRRAGRPRLDGACAVPRRALRTRSRSAAVSVSPRLQCRALRGRRQIRRRPRQATRGRRRAGRRGRDVRPMRTMPQGAKHVNALTPLRPLRPHSHFPKVPTHYLYNSLSHTYGICCKGVRVARNALLEGVSSLQGACKALQPSRKVTAPRRGGCVRRPTAGSNASRGAA